MGTWGDFAFRLIGTLLAGEVYLHQVVCQLSNEASDVRCSVCGQGFLVYWARFSRTEQEQSRRVIQAELRRHHSESLASGEAHEVHPKESFRVLDHCEETDFASVTAFGEADAQAV
jgi:hypothetical protein